MSLWRARYRSRAIECCVDATQSLRHATARLSVRRRPVRNPMKSVPALVSCTRRDDWHDAKGRCWTEFRCAVEGRSIDRHGARCNQVRRMVFSGDDLRQHAAGSSEVRNDGVAVVYRRQDKSVSSC